MNRVAADALESANCGFLVLDPALIVLEANKVIARWHGEPAEALVGRTLGDLLAPGSTVYWEATVEPLLAQQGFAWDVALELRTPSQDHIAVLVNARRQAGTTQCVLFPFSGRRRYERAMRAAQAHARQQRAEIRRLQELDSFRRDFVNAAAHQMATPMTPLQIHFHLLQQALTGNADPKVQRALVAMKTNLDRLSKFASSLVASADIEAGRIGMKIEPVSLADSLPLFVEQWMEHHRSRRDIRVHVAPAVIDADSDALASCLAHLLENAVKFSPARSVIDVSIEAGPPVRIVVKDQGRGIDPARIEALARPFVQAHEPSDVTDLGAGLGLHIVDGLMKAQGGRLIVRSAGSGKGTTAILEFPASSQDIEPASASDLRAAMEPHFT